MEQVWSSFRWKGSTTISSSSERAAGDIIQKFVTYRLRLAVVGDIARHLGEGSALRDFVREANRGAHVWFVASREELDQRLRC